jgi:hypothetical protein
MVIALAERRLLNMGNTEHYERIQVLDYALRFEHWRGA